VSRASENPVHCARQVDLGCPAEFPGSKFDAIQAGALGWFFSRDTEDAFCPAHVPDWVEKWRARKKSPCRREVPPPGPERDAWLAEHPVPEGSPFG
jgi:hypothetical protein